MDKDGLQETLSVVQSPAGTCNANKDIEEYYLLSGGCMNRKSLDAHMYFYTGE